LETDAATAIDRLRDYAEITADIKMLECCNTQLLRQIEELGLLSVEKDATIASLRETSSSLTAQVEECQVILSQQDFERR
jgi:hypothetical protein